MFYDLLYKEDINYWKEVTLEKPDKQPSESKKSYEIRIEYYKAIKNLLKQYKKGISYDAFVLNRNMFELF